MGIAENDVRVPDGVELFYSYEYSDEKDVGRVIYQSAIGKKKAQGDYPLYIKIGREREKFYAPSLYGNRRALVGPDYTLYGTGNTAEDARGVIWYEVALQDGLHWGYVSSKYTEVVK